MSGGKLATQWLYLVLLSVIGFGAASSNVDSTMENQSCGSVAIKFGIFTADTPSAIFKVKSKSSQNRKVLKMEKYFTEGPKVLWNRSHHYGG